MSLYRRPSSSHWWCRFTLGGREVRQSTGTADRREAEEYETRLRSRYWRAHKLGESFYTFGQAADRWLTDSKDEHNAQRVAWFNQDMRDLPLREITGEVIASAREALRRDGLSERTTDHYMAVLRAILRAARDWQWLDAIPKVPMYQPPKPDARWLTREQFRELVKHLPPHTADMARFAVATGLRRANITGLTWDRVDLKRRTAFIPGSQAKARRGIAVPLSSDAVAVLKRWKGKHPTHVFSFRGKPVYQVATRAWREACRKAGVPGVRFHDLRHTWASWQVQAETPLSVVQALGGWESPQMVQRYAHLSPGHLKAYADRTNLGTPRKRAAKK